ncbi:MAG TPA: hypothetical protein VN688_02325, partial [Gemmataceae bacterium]|nr:hypothetical protein [Gemmataceae bacterium]
PRVLHQDRRLTYNLRCTIRSKMPGNGPNSLFATNTSYAQLSTLCKIIGENWRLFVPFLPPKSIWDAKLEEVRQIRHRVAHFRSGHHDDLQRVNQLLRDIDRGFWLFCTSYNNPTPVLPQSDDLVEEHFLHLDPFPWSRFSDGKWGRCGIADPEAYLSVTVEVLRRPWTKWTTPVSGKEGFLYDVRIGARKNRTFDYSRLLQSTSGLHKHFVHLCLDNLFQSVRLTLPAVLGAERVIAIVEKVIDTSGYCISSGVRPQSAQLLADSWPEYMLGPENPLTFLDPEMECSFFGV